jgi:hypothetical protein
LQPCERANWAPHPYQESSDKDEGVIIFGGYDRTKWIDTLVPFPIVYPSPRGAAELNIEGPVIEITVGDDTYDLPNQSYTVLLDTGSTYTYLPDGSSTS